MERKIYSAECKLSLIKEYLDGKLTMRAFCKEKDLCLSTLESWLTKVRKHGLPIIEAFSKKTESDSLAPIDVAAEVKKIISDETYVADNVFTLEIKGIKLSFAISNLKDVLEVIK